jgi:heme/copper-type cytochrome/quinol oxidase subunit 2
MAAHSPETTRERETPRTTATPHDGRAPAPTRGSSGGALAAMIVGIIAMPMGLIIPIVGIVMGIVAIVLGANARRKGATNSGQATAGIVCGGIGILIALGLIIAAVAISSS